MLSGSSSSNWWQQRDSSARPLYSDHAPVVLTNPLGILSWNIMNQGRFDGSRTNNGYGITESQSDYEERLKNVARAIADLVKQNGIGLVALQEIPLEETRAHQLFSEYLQKLLPEYHMTSATPTPGTTSARAILVNRTRYSVEPRPENPRNFGEQAGHIQTFTIKAHSGSSFLFANGHLKFGKDPIRALQYLMQQGYCFAGDCNAVIPNTANIPTQAYCNTGGNFSYNATTGTQNPTTQYDHILVSKEYIGVASTSQVLSAASQAAPPPQAEQTILRAKPMLYSHNTPTFNTQNEAMYVALFINSMLPPAIWQSYSHVESRVVKLGSDPMSYFQFDNKEAAEFFLKLLRTQGIVTNAEKQVYNNSVGLGKTEMDRLVSHAQHIVNVSASIPSETATTAAPLHTTPASNTSSEHVGHIEYYSEIITLLPEHHGAYIGAKPLIIDPTRPPMTCFTFTQAEAAQAFLSVLRENNIVTTQKQVIGNTLALGDTELRRFKELAQEVQQQIFSAIKGYKK